jgi:hypothetical protein
MSFSTHRGDCQECLLCQPVENLSWNAWPHHAFACVGNILLARQSLRLTFAGMVLALH